MIDLLATEKALLAPHLRAGGAAADFTMGNGHDTLWLSREMGEGGRVYAFDVQQQALDSTKALLEKENAPRNYTLIRDSHHRCEQYIREKLCVGMFNLGWLPGGDKRITTLRETTLPALQASIRLLDDDGGILLAVYPGHEEGRLEGELITEYLASLDRRRICCSQFRIVNSLSSPFFFLIEKK